MKDLPDSSVDLVLCDPPYGTTECTWDHVLPFDKLWKEYRRVLKPTGIAVLFASQPFTTRLIGSNMADFRYCWYWKKNNVTGAMFAKVQPMRCIEDICVFYRKAPTYNPQGLIELEKPRQRKAERSDVYGVYTGTPRPQRFTNYPKHLLEFPNEAVNSRNRLHPTQKPVALLEYLVRTYTNPGETVLDNCMGSGSTGVACINAGRRFIGMEQDVGYFVIASNRIEEAYHGRHQEEDPAALQGSRPAGARCH